MSGTKRRRRPEQERRRPRQTLSSAASAAAVSVLLLAVEFVRLPPLQPHHHHHHHGVDAFLLPSSSSSSSSYSTPQSGTFHYVQQLQHQQQLHHSLIDSLRWKQQELRRRQGRRQERSFAVSVAQADDRIGTEEQQQQIGDNDNDDDIVTTLQSYVYNLQRSHNHNDGPRQNRHEVKAAKSLVYFLSHSLLQDQLPTNDREEQEALIVLLERAITQALRRAGEAQDYKLILNLIDASIAFANHRPVLTPRVFGEAIEALSQRTDANVAKIKSVWNRMAAPIQERQQHQQVLLPPTFLTGPPTAYELNIYLKALASRGKSRACVDTFRQYSVMQGKQKRSQRNDSTKNKKGNDGIGYIQPDAYTASILFTVLTDSITSNQKPARQDDEMHYSSPDSSHGDSLQSKLLVLSSWSTCWQWNAAVNILDSLQCDNDYDNDGCSSWNNHAYSSLLKLQAKAQRTFGNGRGHDHGPQLTMAILDDMMRHEVMPDEITCTLAIKAMGDLSAATYDDENRQSSENLAVDFLDQMRRNPRLPSPNTYACAATIMACARQGDDATALQLLEDMRAGVVGKSSSPPPSSATSTALSTLPPPNTWAYNAVLLALDESYGEGQRRASKSNSIVNIRRRKPENKKRRQRTQRALSLLDQMKADHANFGMETVPDTVTYNTILGMGPFFYQQDGDSNDQDLSRTTLSLLNEMSANGIVRDEVTYRNAVASSGTSGDILDILRLCLDDKRDLSTASLTSIFNEGLLFLSSRRDFATFKEVLSKMSESCILMDVVTMNHLIVILGKCGHASRVDDLLTVLDGTPLSTHSSGAEDVLGLIGLGAAQGQFPLLEISEIRNLYTEGISACLSAGNFKQAHSVLEKMRANGLQPSRKCIEFFSSAYAQSSIEAAEKESKALNTQRDDGKETSISQRRAASAFKIVIALEDPYPHPNILGRVAKACARTNQWGLAKALLQRLHKGLVETKKEGSEWDYSTMMGVKATHNYMLRQCAAQGNMTASLWLASDIQALGRSMLHSAGKEEDTPSRKFVAYQVDEEDFFIKMRDLTSLPPSIHVGFYGMNIQNWISLIKTASKTGHWRISVTSLQRLKPYVERTKLADLKKGDESLLNDRYNQMAPAIVATAKCLEQASQYAWALRVTEDWIRWSGRRPRAEVVLSTIRVLAANGLGEEIKQLLSECIAGHLTPSPCKEGVVYEEMLFLGAVTSLHVHGMYDDADEVFMTGVSSGYLSFDLTRQNQQFMLDLHGLNVALAHSAVRVAMRRQAAKLEEEGLEDAQDMMIVTGRGRSSALHLRPILRPEVQRMLTEEFYPSLSSFSVPGNTGCLCVPSQDVQAWQRHQQQQKGARMLELASLLKEASSPGRLKHIIALSLEAGDE